MLTPEERTAREPKCGNVWRVWALVLLWTALGPETVHRLAERRPAARELDG
jgi:hypothetical protein